MAIFATNAYASGISTPSMLFFRFLIATLTMLPIALIQKREFPKGKDLVILMGMGMIGYAGQSYSFFTALTLIPAPLVAILLYLYPVIVAVLSIFVLNEKFKTNRVIALMLAVTGTFLVIGFEAGSSLKGIFFGISAAVIYSVYTIVGSKVMARNDAFTASIVVIASACLVYGAVNLKTGLMIPDDPVVWVNIVCIAIICTFIAIYTYFEGMKSTGAVNAAMLSTFEPVTTMLLASIFLGQYIRILQFGGTAMILASAIIISMYKKE